MKIEKDRKQKFIEFVAMGIEPYRACINAGYSPKYAKTNSHIMREKYENEIEAFKPIAKQAIEEEFKYSIKESFEKLNEIQELAMMPNNKGDYTNLSPAVKAEELKGKLAGIYKEDNEQKAASLNLPPTINIQPVKANAEL